MLRSVRPSVLVVGVVDFVASRQNSFCIVAKNGNNVDYRSSISDKCTNNNNWGLTGILWADEYHYKLIYSVRLIYFIFCLSLCLSDNKFRKP